MVIIQQGDQYLIPFVIKKDDVIITPENASDIRIQVGKNLKQYSKEEITFDADSNKWFYPLTQKESLEFENVNVTIQIGIKQNNEIYYSPAKTVLVGDSIIKENW